MDASPAQFLFYQDKKIVQTKISQWLGKAIKTLNHEKNGKSKI